MSDFALKTYKDSYLYNKSDGSENLMKKHDKSLINFINSAERIDKDSDQFSGVVEDVKRQQTSSILYTVLMMPNVHLCINSVELPPAFKVFDAYDIKLDRRPAVFIDVTKLIVLKNGYFVCKNIGKLVSYLFAALVYLTYRKDPVKLLNNSAISINGVECYVAMFNYILDYLRIIGYSANKEKISYLAGLFFLVNMMGKDLDSYTKNLAAKTAKVNPASISAYEYYIEDGIFDNIDNFITILAETFKLKGFTTEVFVQKWIYAFGNGSQYATELFSSFTVLMTYAFTGAYVINQKQIEKCCGQAMVKYCNALLIIGVDVFDVAKTMRESDNILRDVRTLQLRESLRMRSQDTSDIAIMDEDYSNIENLKSKIKENVNFLKDSRQRNKISTFLEKCIAKCCDLMDDYILTGKEAYETGAIGVCVEAGRRYFDDNDHRKIYKLLSSKIGSYSEAMDNSREDEISKRYASAVVELRNVKNNM